jgi:hypothetical protein
MMNTEVATGSVAGRTHRRLSRPNQDAVSWTRTATGVVLVVCDGCGGAPRSEVGAALGARLWSRALAERLDAGVAAGAALFEAAGADVIAHLSALAAAMAPDPTAVVVDHFMFTSLAAVITPEVIAVHAIGDGVVALGDAVSVIGPFPENQPPYLAQALVGSRPSGKTWIADPREIDRVAIASDGAGALPCLDDLAADVVFRNPAALTRKLALLAEDQVEIDWEARRVVRTPAVLDDDTTIAMARWSRAGQRP